MTYRREFSSLDDVPHARTLRTRYDGIKQRCFDPNSNIFQHYGGRGITMCAEWCDSFKAFYEWSMDNGFEPHLSIERIDNDGNYEPPNCRWATKREQANNRRSSRILTVNGVSATLSKWAEVAHLSREVIARRLDRGWPLERALTEEAIRGRNQFNG